MHRAGDRGVALLIEDGRRLAEGARLEAEICIIGAGPAGITIAGGLARTGARVILLELGGDTYDRRNQTLLEGEVAGDAYPPLRDTRFAGLGGASALWAGWCRPLDPIDFEARPEIGQIGWPFDRKTLDPFYARAQQLCAIGRYDYTVRGWQDAAPAGPLPLAGSDLESTIFQVSPVDFGKRYGPELAGSGNVRVLTHAPVIALDLAATGGRIERVHVRTLAGNAFEIGARFVVLAAGGVENARLMLASGEDPARSIGNGRDLVGRFFAEHAFIEPGRLIMAEPGTDFGLYLPFASGTNGSGDSWTRLRGVFTLTEATLRREALLNCAIIVMPAYEASPVFADPNVKAGLELWEKLRGRGAPGAVTAHLARALRAPHKIAHAAARRVFLAGRRRSPIWRLRSFIESRPLADNRVTLGARKDALGRALPHLNWSMDAHDLYSVSRAYGHFGRALSGAGLGRVALDFPDESAHWRRHAYGGKHHMGTTRMHASPSQGVVDADCRVHGHPNLFVAGSSVFPTTGYVNPTLTIVALAIRLADHLSDRLHQ